MTTLAAVPVPMVRVPLSVVIILIMFCAVVVLVPVVRHGSRIIQRRAPLPSAFPDVSLGVAALLLGIILVTVLTVAAGEQPPPPEIRTTLLEREP